MQHGEYKMPGGKLIVADLELRARRIAAVQISGDFFIEPDSARAAIDAALRGAAESSSEDELSRRVADALGPEVQLYGISPTAVAVAVRRALVAGVRA